MFREIGQLPHGSATRAVYGLGNVTKMGRSMTKLTKWHVHTVTTQISLHEEAMGPWLSLECTAKADQTWHMPRLI